MKYDNNLNPLLREMSQSPEAATDLSAVFDRHGLDMAFLELDHEGTLTALADEIRLDGSNTLASVFRGHGVGYKEVVLDVARKLKLEPNEKAPIEEVENGIIGAVSEKYWAGLSEEERLDVTEQIRLIDPEVTVDGFLTALKGGGAAAMTIARPIVIKVTQKIITTAAAKSLGVHAAKRVSGAAGMLVPGLNVLLAGWTIIDIAGPAFRKTVPTVIQLSFWRMQLSLVEA